MTNTNTNTAIKARFDARHERLSNLVISAKAGNAKNKAPTKAERQRTNLTKANAKAAKALPDASFDTLAANLVTKSGQADGAARTMAHYMNHEFAEPMKAFRCHWSAFTPANCRSDNEKAILARIETYRKQVQELALVKGLANINKPWSDMRRVAIDLFQGGKPRERVAVALDAKQKKGLTALYKAGMKEERQTPEEEALNVAIGELLIAYFKVDLSTLG